MFNITYKGRRIRPVIAYALELLTVSLMVATWLALFAAAVKFC